jgi:hypothetical protein
MNKVLATIAAMIAMALTVYGVSAQDIAPVVVPDDATVVVWDWSQFLAVFFGHLANPQSAVWTVFGAVMVWLSAKLPGPALWLFRVFQVEQLLTNALRASLYNTQKKFERGGGVLTVDLRNEIVADAVQYALDNGQSALIKWMGGADGTRVKITARAEQEIVSAGFK